MNRLIILCFLLTYSLFSYAEKSSSQTINKRSGQLPNGLTYYVVSTPWVKGKSTLGMVVKTGSLYETREEVGVAHYLEHLCASCVPGYNADYMLKAVQRAGLNVFTDFQAFTSDVRTVYKYTYPSDDEQTEKLFCNFLNSVLTEMNFTDEAVNIERPIILKETQSSYSNSVKSHFQGGYYENHATIGNKEQLNLITRERINSFYKKWYNLDNLAIVLAGDRSLDQLEQKIKDSFSSLEGETIAKTPNPEIFNQSNISLYTNKNSNDKSLISWRFRLEDMSSDSGIKRAISNELACNLLKGAVESLDNTIDVNVSMYSNLPKTSLINILFNAKDSTSYKSKVNLVSSCVAKITNQVISKTLLDSIWYGYKTQLVSVLSNKSEVPLDKVVNDVFSLYVNGLPFVSRDEYMKRLDHLYSTVELDEVQDAAKRIFGGHFGMVAYLPDYGLDWETKSKNDFIRNCQMNHSDVKLCMPEKVKMSPIFHDKRRAIEREKVEFTPDMIIKEEQLANGFIQYNLKNGMRLIWQKSDVANSVLLKIDSKDIFYELAAKNKHFSDIKSTRAIELIRPNGEVLNDILNGWDLRKCAIGINSKGVHLSSNWNDNNREFLFDFLSALYDGIRLDDTFYKQQSKQWHQKLSNKEENVYDSYSRKIRDNYNFVNVDHSQELLSKEESELLLKRMFNPGKTVVFVSGDIDAEEVIASLSSISSKNSEKSKVENVENKYLSWYPEKDSTFYSPAKGKTKLVSRFYKLPVENLELKDIVLAGMLEEYLSRMTLKIIRTEKGLIYSWGSSTEVLTMPEDATLVGVRFLIVPELLDESRKVLDQMCEDIKTMGVTADDLQGLKQRQWNRYLDCYNDTEELLPFVSKQINWFDSVISDSELRREIDSISLAEFNKYVYKCLTQNSLTLIK